MAGTKRGTSAETDQRQDESKRGRSTVLGPKIQMYTEDGQLVETFKQLITAVRSVDGTTRDGIVKAYRENLVYAGHRWMSLGRDRGDDTLQQLPHKKEPTKTNRKGFVAELSQDETTVIHVYANCHVAGAENDYPGKGTVQKIIDRGGLFGKDKHRVRMWSDCSDALKKGFLDGGGVLPLKAFGGRQKRILKLDAATEDVVQEYATAADVVKEIGCSPKTLNKVMLEGLVKQMNKVVQKNVRLKHKRTAAGMIPPVDIRLQSANDLRWLSTLIDVDKERSDELVGKAATNVFGSKAGHKISEYISLKNNNRSTNEEIKKSIEDLAFIFSGGSSRDNAKAQKCEKTLAHVRFLLASKSKNNKDLVKRLEKAQNSFSPEQSRMIDALREQTNEQTRLIASLQEKAKELDSAQSTLLEKEREIGAKKILVTERDRKIKDLKALVQRRERTVAEGNETIRTLRDNLNKLEASGKSNQAQIEQHVKRLQEMEASVRTYEKQMKSALSESDKKIEDLNSQVTQLESAKKKLVADLQTSGQSNEDQNSQHEIRVKKMNATIKQCEDEKASTLSEKKRIVSECNQRINELSDQVTQLDKTLRSLRESSQSNEAELSSKIKEALENLKANQEMLQECDEEKNRKTTRIEEIESELSKVTRELNKVKTTSETFKTELWEKASTLDKTEEKLEELRDSLEKSDKRLKEHQSETDALLRESEVTVTGLNSRIKGLEGTIGNDTVKKATDYLRQVPGSRDPTEQFLHETYGKRFMIIRNNGNPNFAPMSTDYSRKNRMNDKDVEIFCKDYLDIAGHVVITKVIKKQKTQVTVSLKGKSFFDTYLKVFFSNTSSFTGSGQVLRSDIMARKFLLLLYIIHLEGVYDNEGNLVIKPEGASSSNQLQDMFAWL